MIEAEKAIRDALAAGPEPIYVCLYGDRYFQGPYSQADLSAEQDAYVTACNPTAMTELLAEIERLRVDAERLDWLERQDLNDTCVGFVIDAPHDGEYSINVGTGPFYGKSLRAAIDSAKQAKEQS